MPERRRYSSLRLVHSHGVKHNFLFTFPFPQVLNNAPKIYVEIESKRRDMKQSVSGVACVCIFAKCYTSRGAQTAILVHARAAVQSVEELGEVEYGSPPVTLLVSLL